MFAGSGSVVADSVSLQTNSAVVEDQVVLALSGFCFSREKRLLKAADYKSVFDAADFKFPHKNLLVLANYTGNKNARLGLVVAKKNAKLAVQRNRLKRIVRESFRQQQAELVGLDIIVLVRPGLWQQQNEQIRQILQDSWRRMIKQRNKYLAQQVVIAP